MEKYPFKEMHSIMQKHWQEMMTELDNYIDTDFLNINIKLLYEFFDEGFELKLR
jgi:hypothetical protein